MQAMHRDRPRVHVALAAHVSKMRQMTPEARKAYVRPAIEARVRKMLAWCPVEYRGLYRELTNAKRVPATEARTLVEQQIERDRQTYLRTGRLPQSERMAA
ncbi:hypothetical protein Pan3_54 [Pseudanabaena phage Pan3]|nr:hypothetical protein Pan3_54 [Pseudanabaena phage Pan3]